MQQNLKFFAFETFHLLVSDNYLHVYIMATRADTWSLLIYR